MRNDTCWVLLPRMDLLQSIVYLNADSSRLARQKEQILESEVRLKKLMALENLEEKIVIERYFN